MDDRTVAEARAGSAEAFTVIYAELGARVLAYLRAKGVPDPEDVTSEVFVAVFTGIRRFEGDVAGLRSWVFTIAHRRAVDHWRGAARRPATVEYEVDDDLRTTPSAESTALEQLGADRLLGLLDRLTDEQREVLLLRIVADLPIEEVARTVGRPAGAVKALQRRALATLRRILDKESESWTRKEYPGDAARR